MPSLNIEENIKKLQDAVETTYQELHRLQGSLRVFVSLKENGVTTIDIPEKEEKEDEEDEEEGEIKEEK
jgi:hypothetical protein